MPQPRPAAEAPASLSRRLKGGTASASSEATYELGTTWNVQASKSMIRTTYKVVNLH